MSCRCVHVINAGMRSELHPAACCACCDRCHFSVEIPPPPWPRLRFGASPTQTADDFYYILGVVGCGVGELGMEGAGASSEQERAGALGGCARAVKRPAAPLSSRRLRRAEPA
jgi:hypothetical protein